MFNIESKKQFESFIDSIIFGNPYVIDSLCESVKTISIEIDSEGYSGAIASLSEVQFGLKDHNSICELYDTIKNIIAINKGSTNIEEHPTFYVEYIWSTSSGLSAEQHLEKIKEVTMYEPQDVLSHKHLIYIGVCSFILYHEIGHILKDNCPEDVFSKEQTADEFAFKAIINNSTSPRDQDACVIGALLALFNILYSQKLEDIPKDIKHPHPLERIANFLRKIDICKDSSLWQVCYRLLMTCLKKHKIKISESEVSGETFYEKFARLIGTAKTQYKNDGL